MPLAELHAELVFDLGDLRSLVGLDQGEGLVMDDKGQPGRVDAAGGRIRGDEDGL